MTLAEEVCCRHIRRIFGNVNDKKRMKNKAVDTTALFLRETFI